MLVTEWSTRGFTTTILKIAFQSEDNFHTRDNMFQNIKQQVFLSHSLGLSHSGFFSKKICKCQMLL